MYTDHPELSWNEAVEMNNKSYELSWLTKHGLTPEDFEAQKKFAIENSGWCYRWSYKLCLIRLFYLAAQFKETRKLANYWYDRYVDRCYPY